MDHIRELPLLAAVGVLFCIVMLRANATYWIGRAAVRGGRASRFERHLNGRHMERAQHLTARYGVVAVPLCFLTVGIQTATNFTAGFTQMPVRRYLPAVVVGCVIWAVFYALVGTVAIELVWRLVSHG